VSTDEPSKWDLLPRAELVAVDKLAREMYAANLMVEEGFSEAGADRISTRQVPDSYYSDAQSMRSQLGADDEDGDDA
jgi:hypothetical protein